MSWSLAHIENLAKSGKIKGYKVIGKEPAPDELKQIKPEAEGLQFIKKQLDKNKIGYLTELQFAKPRKFRFDIAIPALNIAIEYEGLAFKKTGHTTSDGYTKNWHLRWDGFCTGIPT
jgi:hypothetical protein